jgi:murein DD-endopeptidase MepM/ murein hydrolase activator NlpD
MLRISLISIALGISTFLTAGNDKTERTARDTSVAVVVYDARAKFVPDAHLNVEDYSVLIDSLVRLDTVPVSLVNQLNIYRMLAAESTQRLPLVIDSIFEAEDVPQPVLNAVNMFMTSREEALRAPTGFAAYVPESPSPYPAQSFYEDWNTLVSNPSRNDLSRFDTTLTLLLTDESSNCGFEVPFKGVVTSTFGWRYGRNHNGIDIDLEVWDPVKSAFPGVVRVARYYKGFGRVVVVRHYNGLETTYAHLHRFKVKPGDIVEAGDVVGLGGSSGNSTGSHLHFEIRFQGVPIKPSDVINFKTHELRSEVITLSKSGAFLAARPPSQTPNKVEYLVKSGDYLYKIAREFGVSVDDICTLNGISRTKKLKAGQKLIVKT